MKILYLLIVTTIVIYSSKCTLSQSVATVTFGFDQYMLKYNQSQCDLLQSANVSNGIKCLILCQTTMCKSVNYSSLSNVCILNDSRPELIEYDQLPNLNITYLLSSFLKVNDSCRFSYTCSTPSNIGYPTCFNGTCKCFRDLDKYNTGLVYEWTFNNTLEDSVQCNDLTRYPNASFVLESTSPQLYSGYVGKSGYFSAPPDVYFNQVFSVTALVNVISVTSWARVADFGNGAPMDNFELALSRGTNGQPLVELFSLNSYLTSTRSPIQLPLLSWTHLAAVFNSSVIKLYMNATEVAWSSTSSLRNVVRYRNYIGKSNWPDSLADCKYRNLRIFNRPLSVEELLSDMIT